MGFLRCQGVVTRFFRAFSWLSKVSGSTINLALAASDSAILYGVVHEDGQFDWFFTRVHSLEELCSSSERVTAVPLVFPSLG